MFALCSSAETHGRVIKHTPATETRVVRSTRYLPQLLLLLQSDRLGWIGHLDFVVFTGADSGLGDLDRPLQIGPPHTIHVPKQKHKQVPHRQDFYSAVNLASCNQTVSLDLLL